MSLLTVTWTKTNTIWHEIYSGENMVAKVGDILTANIDVGSGKSHLISVIGIDFFGNRSVKSNTISEAVPLALETLIPTESDWLASSIYADVTVTGEIIPDVIANRDFWFHGGRVYNIPLTQDFELECNIKQLSGSGGKVGFGLTYGSIVFETVSSPFMVEFDTNIVLLSYGTTVLTISETPNTTLKYMFKGIDNIISFWVDGILRHTFSEERSYYLAGLFSVRNDLRGLTNITLRKI